MINLFEMGVNIFENAIAIVFLTLYFGCKYRGYRKIVGMIFGIGLSTIAITALNHIFIYEGFYGLIIPLIYFLYTCIFLKGDKQTKLFISFSIDCTNCVVASIIQIIMCNLFDINILLFFDFSIVRIVWIILAKAVLIIVCVILLKFKVKNILNMKDVIPPIILMLLTESTIIAIDNIVSTSNEFYQEITNILFSIAVMIILAYYTFVKLNYNAQLQKENIKLKQKYELDKQHTYDIMELYEKTCGVRHDLDIYFTTALSYLDSNVGKAREYMQSIVKNKLGKNFITSDNDCFNAIVNTKISVCESLGIYVQVNVMNKSLNRLADDEIGIIFGNLFDNAIRASKESTEKAIELNINLSGECLSIVMLNSIDRSVLTDNRDLQTTKANKDIHGFGTKNIKHIVESHDGIINYFEEDGYFGCQIII